MHLWPAVQQYSGFLDDHAEVDGVDDGLGYRRLDGSSIWSSTARW